MGPISGVADPGFRAEIWGRKVVPGRTHFRANFSPRGGGILDPRICPPRVSKFVDEYFAEDIVGGGVIFLFVEYFSVHYYYYYIILLLF